MLGHSFVLAVATDTTAGYSQTGWVILILREFGRAQVTGFILDLAQWTLLGASLGLVLAAVACAGFSRLRWYDVQWRFARGIRWTTVSLTILLTAFLFGVAGFWKGAVHGSERVLSKSQLATDVFPKIADAIADGMAWLQFRAAAGGNTNQAELSLKVEEFRARRMELHAPQFLEQLNEFQGAALSDVIAKLEQSVLERTPQLKGGLGETLLHQFLNGLGRLLVEKQAMNELKNYGADRVYLAIREQLANEASKDGHPETITRLEISRFIVRDGIVPGMLRPIRSTARAQQLPLICIAILVIVVPPVGIRLIKSRFDRPSHADSAKV